MNESEAYLIEYQLNIISLINVGENFDQIFLSRYSLIHDFQYLNCMEQSRSRNTICIQS